jgi:hypothetical protein
VTLLYLAKRISRPSKSYLLHNHVEQGDTLPEPADPQSQQAAMANDTFASARLTSRQAAKVDGTRVIRTCPRTSRGEIPSPFARLTKQKQSRQDSPRERGGQPKREEVFWVCMENSVLGDRAVGMPKTRKTPKQIVAHGFEMICLLKGQRIVDRIEMAAAVAAVMSERARFISGAPNKLSISPCRQSASL